MVMNGSDKPIEGERVACEVCLKEISLSEAMSEEASDYIIHFCGLACYEKWKKRKEEAGD